jgi:hypothetical protein
MFKQLIPIVVQINVYSLISPSVTQPITYKGATSFGLLTPSRRQACSFFYLLYVSMMGLMKVWCQQAETGSHFYVICCVTDSGIKDYTRNFNLSID